MNESHYRVCVVLDRTFGDRLATLLSSGPVWIVDSPVNRVAAYVCWEEKPNASHLERITLFTALGTTSAEEALIAELPTIDLHHGEHSAPVPYSKLEVVGSSRTPAIQAAFAEYGFQHFEDTECGFKAKRELSRPV